MNLEIWNKLHETNPDYTKPFKRSGGFSGTAQNPTYAIKKMTDTFGVVGKGWGVDKPDFNVQHAGEEIAVYCTVGLWVSVDGERCYSWGVGGDFVLNKNKYGLKADDEAFKKSYTDAVGNAMKFFGVAADLHLGMFDDSKYVNDLEARLNNSTEPVEKKTPDAPYKPEEKKPVLTPNEWAERQEKVINGCLSASILDTWHTTNSKALDKLKGKAPVLHEGLIKAYNAKLAELNG